MELRHLRYFVAVAEEGHLTRAAVALGMAQPPLSQQIRVLERELGVELFRRLPRGMALTAAGEAFLGDARQVLEGVGRAAARALRAARGEEGEIVIGVTTSAILHPMIPRIIAALSLRFPRIELTVREGNAADITDSLEKRTMGAGFLRAPVSRPPGVDFRQLLTEELVVVLPAGHALAAPRRDAITLRDLRAERFILTRRPSMPGMYDDLLTACRAAGFEPLIAAEVGRMLTNINLVAAGMGVSVVPASMRKIRLSGVRYMRLSRTHGLLAPLTVATIKDDQSPIIGNLLSIIAALNGGDPKPRVTLPLPPRSLP